MFKIALLHLVRTTTYHLESAAQCVLEGADTMVKSTDLGVLSILLMDVIHALALKITLLHVQKELADPK